MTDAPRALIVDDDIDLGETACEIMADAGVLAIHRKSISDAIDAMSQYGASIRVLLTDVNLATPMSGIELAVYVAQEWPDVSICVTSGLSAERPRRIPDTAAFLPKPWRSADLIGVLRSSGCLD